MEGKHRGRRPSSRNYPLAFKQQVVAEANDPSRSIAEVALAHGLNANMISYWRRTLARADASTPSDEINFVPVRMTEEARHASRVILEHGAMRICFEGPVDAAVLRTVLDVLRGVP